jgi:hypothetical protein
MTPKYADGLVAGYAFTFNIDATTLAGSTVVQSFATSATSSRSSFAARPAVCRC